MEYINLIESIIGSKSKVRILNFLIKNKGSFSANQISKKISMTPRAVLLAIEELTNLNIVKTELKNKDKIYSINNDNWFVINNLNMLFNNKQYDSEMKLWIKNKFKDYLSDIYSILYNKKGNIIIILKELTSMTTINSIKEEIKENIQSELECIFSQKIKFDFFSIFSDSLIKNIDEYESIYGLEPKNLKSNLYIKKDRLERAKDFFGV